MLPLAIAHALSSPSNERDSAMLSAGIVCAIAVGATFSIHAPSPSPPSVTWPQHDAWPLPIAHPKSLPTATPLQFEPESVGAGVCEGAIAAAPQHVTVPDASTAHVAWLPA